MDDKDFYMVRVKHYCMTFAGNVADGWISTDRDFLANAYDMGVSPVAAGKELLRVHGFRH